jgi:photosystem II stability/assembly factor-like uncharacterized protein
MKKRLNGLVLLACLFSYIPNTPAVTPTLAQGSTAASIRDFGLVAPGAGWLLFGERLYWTDDDGADWRDITPPDGSILAVDFLDARTGWAFFSSTAGFFLARTSDAGRGWDLRPVSLPLDESLPPAASLEMDWLDPQNARLTVKHQTGSNFDLRTGYLTRDGGRTWTRAETRVARPAEELPTEGFARQEMADSRSRWALSVEGECRSKADCTLTERLVSTRDGGRSWQPVTLPGAGLAGSVRELASETGTGFSPRALSNTGVLTSQGFDVCEIPGIDAMRTWWKSSPYYAVNLYIGGAARACANANLSKAYLGSLADQGWKFIPTWVGPQAPCSIYSVRMSSDPLVAYQQGLDEASAAVNRAASLGLTLPDKTGTVIYYDLEAYNVSNTACKEAATAFISGWSDQMEASGNIAGVYGATCSSGLDSIAALSNPPQAAWLANWVHFKDGYYDPEASVWNVACLPASYWTNQTRLRQYEGTHTEVWGGLGLSMDSNVLDGIVASLDGSGPVPKTVNDNSYLVRYDGWGNYQLPATFGGGYRFTSQPGQALTCKKNVNAATVYVLAYKGPDQGKAQILVDGNAVRTVDLYRSEPRWVNIPIADLPVQAHTIVIKALGTKRSASTGAEVRVTGCRFGAISTDDLSYDFTRLGNWTARKDARMPDGWYRISGTKGAQLSFHVTGTAFTWKSAAGPWYGMAQILVDGTPYGTVDLYQPTWAVKDIPVTGLPAGDHQITIRVLRQKNPLSKGFAVGFDGFTVP